MTGGMKALLDYHAFLERVPHEDEAWTFISELGFVYLLHEHGLGSHDERCDRALIQGTIENHIFFGFRMESYTHDFIQLLAVLEVVVDAGLRFITSLHAISIPMSSGALWYCYEEESRS